MRVFGLGDADGLDDVVVGKGAGVHLLVEEVLEDLEPEIFPRFWQSRFCARCRSKFVKLFDW